VLYQYLLGTRRPPVPQLVDELHKFIVEGVHA